jgi:hypothetical protein
MTAHRACFGTASRRVADRVRFGTASRRVAHRVCCGRASRRVALRVGRLLAMPPAGTHAPKGETPVLLLHHLCFTLGREVPAAHLRGLFDRPRRGGEAPADAAAKSWRLRRTGVGPLRARHAGEGRV